MAFLRTLFWIVLTVIVVVFSLRNWTPVTITLFGDLRADIKLPVLLLATFLLGFGPVYLWHRATRWRQGRAPATGRAEAAAATLPVNPPPPRTGAPAPPASPAPGVLPPRAD